MISQEVVGQIIIKSLTGESYVWQPNGANYYSTGTLADGTIFAFHSDSSACNANYGTGKFSRTCGLIYFDINGFKKPNQAGKDYFCLLITKSGVYPRGGKDLHDYSGLICDIKTKSNKNGIPCIAWIIEKGNMDYLYQTVSW